MHARIVEILAKILEGLSNNSSLEEVNHTLVSNQHFDKKILGIAFSLVYDKILSRKKSGAKTNIEAEKNIRMLSEDEKEILGIDNYNYLLHLINVGLLDYSNLESILEQIEMFPENRITRKEINWIILLSLVEYDSSILPGSRRTLYSSDTVN
ncbi:MAG: DUF494 family protein [Bacteroidetes bacterium]|nr:DUF494 family protein [Bacteroidota bacterium]